MFEDWGTPAFMAACRTRSSPPSLGEGASRSQFIELERFLTGRNAKRGKGGEFSWDLG